MDDTRVTTKYCDHCWATNFHYCNIHEIKRKVEYESTNCAMLSEEGIFSLKFQPAVAILQANKLHCSIYFFCKGNSVAQTNRTKIISETCIQTKTHRLFMLQAIIVEEKEYLLRYMSFEYVNIEQMLIFIWLFSQIIHSRHKRR
jgi:hypothetical protein